MNSDDARLTPEQIKNWHNYCANGQDLPQEIAFRLMATYDAATARADRAEAACAALKQPLNLMAGYLKNLGPIIDKNVPEHLRPWKLYDQAVILLKQPNPGAHFLELAQIVEGFSMRTDIQVKANKIYGWVVRCNEEGRELECWFERKLEADALARLLAWRQKEQP